MNPIRMVYQQAKGNLLADKDNWCVKWLLFSHVMAIWHGVRNDIELHIYSILRDYEMWWEMIGLHLHLVMAYMWFGEKLNEMSHKVS